MHALLDGSTVKYSTNGGKTWSAYEEGAQMLSVPESGPPWLTLFTASSSARSMFKACGRNVFPSCVR